MKNEKKIKNFNDILKFLSKDPEYIISHLRQKNKFIKEWLEVFLEERPIIEATVKWRETKNYYPKWSNSFFELAKKICQECPYYINSKCSNSEQKHKCIANYNTLIELQLAELKEANSTTLDEIKEKLVNTLDGKTEFVDNVNAEYSSEIDSGKFDTKKIRTSLNNLHNLKNLPQDETKSEEQEESSDTEQNGSDKNNLESAAEKLQGESKKIDPKEENIILRDMKKYIHCFKLLEIKTDKGVKYYENEFNKIAKNIVEYEHDLSIFKIQRPVINYISLYYLFFWDFLNNMKLRDAPSAFEVESKISERQIWIAEKDVVQLPEDKTPEEVEQQANETELPHYDPSYAQTHPYLFKHEQITIDQFIEMAEKLKRLVHYNKLASISYEDFPNQIKRMFNNLVEKKKMLLSYLTADGKGNIGLNSIKEDKLEKWFKYKIYEQFSSFIIAVLLTSFRKKPPSIPKARLLDICKQIKEKAKQEKNINKVSLSKIIDEMNKKGISKQGNLNEIKYSTITDLLRNKIKDHPNFDKSEDTEKDYKKIIAESSFINNKIWVDGMYPIKF
jgi:tRNA U55 pseudouridine synthase TruB